MGVIGKVLAFLFPPRIPHFSRRHDNLSDTLNYQYRITRTGMDHNPTVFHAGPRDMEKPVRKKHDRRSTAAEYQLHMDNCYSCRTGANSMCVIGIELKRRHDHEVWHRKENAVLTRTM
jgi:hypothetical protein